MIAEEACCLFDISIDIDLFVSFLHLTLFSFLSLLPSIKNSWCHDNDNTYHFYAFTLLPLFRLFVRRDDVYSFSIILRSLLLYYVFTFVVAATVAKRKRRLVFQT